MSWWTKNRKKVGLAAALAAAAAATVASGGTAAPVAGGLLGEAAGTGAAGGLLGGAAPVAGGGMAGAMLGEGAIPMAAMGGEGAIAASQAMTPVGSAMATGGKMMGGLSKANAVMGASQGLLGSQPPPPPQAPMPQPFQQKVNSGYGAQDQLPPELQGLSPDDPRVKQYLASLGRQA